MEFHITMPGAISNLGAIEHAVRAVDPSAMVDIDPAGHELRVATSVGAAQLVSLLSQAGCQVAPDQVAQVPSTCCGGCSG